MNLKDKACEEIDKETVEEVEEEMSPEHLEQLHSKAEELKVKGNNHVKKQEWKKAIDCYTEAIQIFSYDATFYANRALCYLKINEYGPVKYLQKNKFSMNSI